MAPALSLFKHRPNLSSSKPPPEAHVATRKTTAGLRPLPPLPSFPSWSSWCCCRSCRHRRFWWSAAESTPCGLWSIPSATGSASPESLRVGALQWRRRALRRWSSPVPLHWCGWKPNPPRDDVIGIFDVVSFLKTISGIFYTGHVPIYAVGEDSHHIQVKTLSILC